MRHRGPVVAMLRYQNPHSRGHRATFQTVSKERSRKPLFTLSDAYALGPVLRRASMVNAGQGQPTCRDDEGCALLPDQSPLQCKNLPRVHLDLRIAETA